MVLLYFRCQDVGKIDGRVHNQTCKESLASSSLCKRISKAVLLTWQSIMAAVNHILAYAFFCPLQWFFFFFLKKRLFHSCSSTRQSVNALCVCTGAVTDLDGQCFLHSNRWVNMLLCMHVQSLLVWLFVPVVCAQRLESAVASHPLNSFGPFVWDSAAQTFWCRKSRFTAWAKSV